MSLYLCGPALSQHEPQPVAQRQQTQASLDLNAQAMQMWCAATTCSLCRDQLYMHSVKLVFTPAFAAAYSAAAEANVQALIALAHLNQAPLQFYTETTQCMPSKAHKTAIPQSCKPGNQMYVVTCDDAVMDYTRTGSQNTVHEQQTSG